VRADVTLAPGTFYFADAAGSLTAEDTGFPAGLAVSATKLLVRGNRFDAALGGGGGGGDASSFGAGVATSSALYPGEVRMRLTFTLPLGRRCPWRQLDTGRYWEPFHSFLRSLNVRCVPSRCVRWRAHGCLWAGSLATEAM
jgi:hypothetical protein